jgi:alcohol dehydrogenase (NADP+)
MAHQPLGGRPVPVVRAHLDVPFPTEDPMVSALPGDLRERANVSKVVNIATQCGMTPAQVPVSLATRCGRGSMQR